MFLNTDGFPPVIARPAQLFPGIGNQLVQAVFHQSAEVNGRCQLGALRMIAAMQIVVASQGQVKLPNSAQAGHTGIEYRRITRDPKQVVRCRLQAVCWLNHAFHPRRAIHRAPAFQLAQQQAGFSHGCLQLRRCEGAPTKLRAQAFLQAGRQAAVAQCRFQQPLAHFLAHGAQLRQLSRQWGFSLRQAAMHALRGCGAGGRFRRGLG